MTGRRLLDRVGPSRAAPRRGLILLAVLAGVAACSDDGVDRSMPCSEFTSKYDIDSDRDLRSAINDLAGMNGGSISAAEVTTVFGNCTNHPESTVGEALDRGSILTRQQDDDTTDNNASVDTAMPLPSSDVTNLDELRSLWTEEYLCGLMSTEELNVIDPSDFPWRGPFYEVIDSVACAYYRGQLGVTLIEVEPVTYAEQAQEYQLLGIRTEQRDVAGYSTTLNPGYSGLRPEGLLHVDLGDGQPMLSIVAQSEEAAYRIAEIVLPRLS